MIHHQSILAPWVKFLQAGYEKKDFPFQEAYLFPMGNGGA